MNNLISNALKFTTKGKITVSSKLEERDGELVIECAVTDTGIGIRKDKLSVIFDPFVQASSDTTRKYGGTGLGLSICKNLVEMQGGTLSVDSTEGVGTTFTFEISYQRGSASLATSSNDASKIQASYVHNRILMAEDVEVNQFLARIILESKGWQVDIANNGIEALEFLEENDYDLILMDLQMPEMDGITATRAIRQLIDVNKASIPIVALTANALVGNEQEYFDIGMNACLTKPFTEEKLFFAINKVLNPTND
jgi:CheY-like chemotaxis protein/anti-sigma regulatory factor (Ser/Thr protein kinase)